MLTRLMMTQGLFRREFLQNTCKFVSSPFGEDGWGSSPPFGGAGGGFYKQLDIPSVVAMAVSTEIITLMIVFHFSCFIRSNF